MPHRFAIPSLLFCLPTGVLAQSTWYVDAAGAPPGAGTQSNPYTSLQYAVDQSTTLDGDEIVVSQGTYNENLDLTGRDLSFRSVGGPGVTFIGPSDGSTIIYVERGGLKMDGFTIFDDFPGNPASGDGGGIHARFSNVELRSCAIVQCKGISGGGLYWIGGSESLLLEDCELRTNRATDGAGIFATGLGAFTVTIRGCDLHDNYAVNAGGAIMVAGGNPLASLEVVDTEIHGNSAEYGGGVRGEAIHGELSNSRFTSNTAFENGGGASFQGGDEVGPVVVRTCQFQQNRARYGAGIHTVDIDRIHVVDGTRFLFNRAFSPGGLLTGEGGGADLSALNGGLVELALFHGNEGEKGAGLAIRGGISSQAAIEVRQCLITEGMAYGPQDPVGAGVLVDGGYSRFVDSSITLNQTGPDGVVLTAGGGMFLTGGCRVDVDNVQFSENQAGVASIGGFGGAIYGDDVGDLVVRNSLFQLNTAYTRGGAVASPGLFENCTFASNRSGDGGAVLAVGATTLTACDLVLNVAESFSGAGGSGGAVHGPATLIDCELGVNSAHSEGGGTWGANLQSCVLRNNSVVPSNPGLPAMGGGAYGGVLTDCRIFENEAAGSSGNFGRGGAAAMAELTGCEVYGNTAGVGGGTADCSLDRCTLVGNTAVPGPSAVFFSAPGSIENSILWDQELPVLADTSGQLVVRYSNVQSGWPGTGNLNTDPRFWLEIGKDYFLTLDSPCVDSGDPLVQDPDGSRVDMGAHPFDAQHIGEAANYCTAKVTSTGQVPRIQATGVLSLSGPDDCFLDAVNIVPVQFGLFFWGPEPAEIPLFGGTLCVGGSLVRTTVQSSGFGGTYSFHFSQAYLASAGLNPGTQVYGQYWFRDPGYTPPNAIGWTDGVAFTVHP